MADYTIKSVNTTRFTLTANEKELGTLQYEKWFSFKATITLADYRTFTIAPKGIWGTTIELKKEETVLLKFKMNWSGNIIIQTFLDNIERDFVLKHKSLLKGSYVLIDNEEEIILGIQPNFKWKQLNYDYTLTSTERFENLPLKDVLLLSVIHCANYYMSMMAAM